MPLTQEAQTLIAKLESLQQRAASGDREVIHFIKSLKTRALAGDEKARRIYNTFAVIHWKRRKGGDYDRAEAYYQRLKDKEPKAQAKFQILLQRVRSGDPEARQLFSVLKSIHHKWKSSAFTDGPGAPRIGGYGLPEQHRAGIIIGGNEPLIYPHHPSFPSYPSYDNQRHGGGYPMSQFQSGRVIHRGHAGLVNRHPFRGPRIAGVAFQQLTQTALSNLLSLMARVRAMPMSSAVARAVESVSNSTVPAPVRLSTVPRPSGMKLPSASAISHIAIAEPPICTQARSAVARKSPMAMALVAQCAALGFHIPYNPADFPAVAPPAPGTANVLGRVVRF